MYPIQPLRRRLRFESLLLGPLLLYAGCAHLRGGAPDTAVEPASRSASVHDERGGVARSGEKAPADDRVRRASEAPPEGPRPDADRPAADPLPASTRAGPGPPELSMSLAPTWEDVSEAGRALSLPDAIAMAFQRQPRLRAHLESIEQARGHKGIAQSLFYPTLGTAYSVGDST